MTADDLDASLRTVAIECPDCTATLDVGADNRPATDGGVETVRTLEDGLHLQGVDVECDCCGSTVGVYVFP